MEWKLSSTARRRGGRQNDANESCSGSTLNAVEKRKPKPNGFSSSVAVLVAFLCFVLCAVLGMVGNMGFNTSSQRDSDSTIKQASTNYGIADGLFRFLRTSTQPNEKTDGYYVDEENPPGTCILDPSRGRKSWLPGVITPEFLDSGMPWSAEEQQTANHASVKALMELVNFYNNISEERILKLSTNAANSMVEQCLGAGKPNLAFEEIGCEEAARVVKIVSKEFIPVHSKNASCNDMHAKAKLCVYAQYLTKKMPFDQPLKETRKDLCQTFQASLDQCSSLNDYLKVTDWKADLGRKDTPRKRIRDHVHRSIFITELYTVPDLVLPEEFALFTSMLWDYLATYNYVNAREIRDGFQDREALHWGYFVTHIAYMPSGYGRHRQLVKDAPWLFDYIRENFYDAMATGPIGLLAKFIDILRNYGCTEHNDYMVRHGTRYLLHKFQEDGLSWMNHASKETEYPSDYSLILMPWTAAHGVRKRELEPIVPGSYGHAFQKALERGQKLREKLNTK